MATNAKLPRYSRIITSTLLINPHANNFAAQENPEQSRQPSRGRKARYIYSIIIAFLAASHSGFARSFSFLFLVRARAAARRSPFSPRRARSLQLSRSRFSEPDGPNYIHCSTGCLGGVSILSFAASLSVDRWFLNGCSGIFYFSSRLWASAGLVTWQNVMYN